MKDDFTVITTQREADLKPTESALAQQGLDGGFFSAGDAEHKSSHAPNEGLLKLEALLWFASSCGYSQIPKSRPWKLNKDVSIRLVDILELGEKTTWWEDIINMSHSGFSSALAACSALQELSVTVLPHRAFFHLVRAAIAACSHQLLKVTRKSNSYKFPLKWTKWGYH